MKKTFFDYSKLRGRIKEKYGPQTKLAAAMGISEVSLSSKLNNWVEFTQCEIQKACKLLDIDIGTGDMAECFFKEK